MLSIETETKAKEGKSFAKIFIASLQQQAGVEVNIHKNWPKIVAMTLAANTNRGDDGCGVA